MDLNSFLYLNNIGLMLPRFSRKYFSDNQQKVSDKDWSTILRLYRPLETFFTKMWRPGEIKLVK